MSSIPADCLEGLDLNGGWKVIQKIRPAPKSTGGNFSVGYLVEDKQKRIGYLKALDFSKALQSQDPARELQSMTAAYNFERDLFIKCKDHRLSRIVTPLADGTVLVPGNFGPFGNVCYLIFEKADCDIRTQYNNLKAIDLAWCLRSLHHTATGLSQLHFRKIAHQDLKPSNVLVFKNEGSKISDLGCASYENVQSPRDKFKIPGDPGYASPELFYGYKLSDEFQGRLAVDMYLFGSLIFFYFGNLSATQAIVSKLALNSNPNLSNSDFINDLPYIRYSFFEAVFDLKIELTKISKNFNEDIARMVLELCEPDPLLRGHPRNRASAPGQQYGLARYISKLNLLAKRLEYYYL